MIRLNRDDVCFLLELLKLTPELKQTLKLISNGGEVSDEEADELRDNCLDRMDEIGFDESYYPTKTGVELEILVDKLFIGNINIK